MMIASILSRKPILGVDSIQRTLKVQEGKLSTGYQIVTDMLVEYSEIKEAGIPFPAISLHRTIVTYSGKKWLNRLLNDAFVCGCGIISVASVSCKWHPSRNPTLPLNHMQLLDTLEEVPLYMHREKKEQTYAVKIASRSATATVHVRAFDSDEAEEAAMQLARTGKVVWSSHGADVKVKVISVSPL